jgi:hypothetical protein
MTEMAISPLRQRMIEDMTVRSFRPRGGEVPPKETTAAGRGSLSQGKAT